MGAILLEKGADLSGKDLWGSTMLISFVDASGHAKLLILLLMAGVQEHELDNVRDYLL